jgi:hypothetical protein
MREVRHFDPMHLLSHIGRIFVYIVLPLIVGAIVFVAILAALGMAHVSVSFG